MFNSNPEWNPRFRIEIQMQSQIQKTSLGSDFRVPKEQRQSGIMCLLGSQKNVNYCPETETTTSKKIEKTYFKLKY